jgi:uncharacterized RDD family membrane protein YckC
MASATTTGGLSSEASGARAGFGRRFAAALIDGVILFIIGIFVGIAVKSGVNRGVSTAVSLLYFTLFVGGRRGQTPGMAALSIRVIGADDSGPIGYGRAFIRWVGGIISAIPLFLGYFWMLWDKENQCWHDKLASDFVVPVSDYPIRR